MRLSIVALAFALVAGASFAACNTTTDTVVTSSSFSKGPDMDRLPDHVRARLEASGVNLQALDKLIRRQSSKHQKSLLKVLSADDLAWGLSAPAGSPESHLLDQAFEKVKGYQKINK